MSLGLSADWYITPIGDIKMDHSHHVQYAAAFLAGRPLGASLPMHETEPHLAEKWIRAAKAAGRPAAMIKELRNDATDTRKIVAREFNWVRLARARGTSFGMDVWVFDEPTLELIQRSQAWVFEQPNLRGDEVAWINEMSSGDYFELPLKKLLRRGASPEALKHLAHGVGAYRNPPDNPYVIPY